MPWPGNDSFGRAAPSDTDRSSAGGGGPEAVIVPVVFGLIFVVGVVGNSLVMVVIGRAKHHGGGGGARALSPTNIFILNLSVADLLFLLFCVPFHATIYTLPEWVFGAFLCKFGHYFSFVTMLVSIFTLVAMSVDRYVAVVRSRKSACVRSRRNALGGLCLIWSLSLLLSVPVGQHQVLTSYPPGSNSTFCWQSWSGASKRAYKVSILVLGYLLPLLLICCCYARVLCHLQKKMKTMSKKSERSKRKVCCRPGEVDEERSRWEVDQERSSCVDKGGSSCGPGEIQGRWSRRGPAVWTRGGGPGEVQLCGLGEVDQERSIYVYQEKSSCGPGEVLPPGLAQMPEA
ncbi:unnamed protein product [Menidia menidia]|uniref:(Atlantic silverside) hypothetical protein n=1 Tax=Menidia menidia TaxID=238744 RepID=A0A8S4A597_9TELE|nr:unnamed protein product [Menidia menidia]